MRKITLILGLLLSISLGAQTERQKVIVEVGTGTWCPSCPAVVHIIDNFINQGLDIAVIEYHNGDSYTNTASMTRENYYDFPWFPTTYYDSNHIGFNDWATESVHLATYTQRKNLVSNYNIALNNTNLNNNEITGTITLNRIGNDNLHNLKLHVVLTESNIPQNWQGETELDFVERAMFPNANGTPVEFTTNSNLDVDFIFNINSNWNTSNLELVYFLQNDDNKEILQGDATILETALSTTNLSLNNVTVYPNPAQNNLYISSENLSEISKITITNILGKTLIYKDSVENYLNIKNLPKGIYLVSFYVNGIKKTTKFIKK